MIKSSSPLKPTVFIHIGMNKTGSTALQIWLNNNRKMLIKEHSILYPEAGINGAAHYGFSDLFGFKQGLKTEANSKEFSIFSKNLSKEINDSKCNKVVISSENFVIDGNIQKLKDLFQGFNCKIVVYLRRHDSWWESAYNQFLKMVNDPKIPKGINQFIRHQKKVSKFNQFKYLVDSWANIFGKDNIIIRPYEKQQMPKGILTDFANVVGIKSNSFDMQSRKDNRSFSKKSNYILEIAQRSGLSRTDINILIKHLRTIDKKDDGFSLMPAQRRIKILEFNNPQYEYIAKEYLGREDGNLFYTPWPKETENWIKFKPPEPEEVVKIIQEGMRGKEWR